MTTMNDDKNALKELLDTFQVTALGQGDTHRGTNLLAAMAGGLANLAPTDGTVRTHDGRPARLGVSLLVTGSASTGLIRDEVLTEIGLRQANAWKHFLRYAEWFEEQRKKQGAEPPPVGPKSNAAENCFAETLREVDPLFGSIAESWSRALREPPAEQLQHVIERPKFFVSARPSDLQNQLRELRPGRPLIHLGLNQPDDLAQLADPGAALVEGRFTVGNGCEPMYANLLITDPMQMLGEAAKTADNKAAWLGHFLWLCDGDAGPEASETSPTANVDETTTECFRQALDNVITQRLSFQERKPISIVPDTREATFRWTAFLREMEPRLPGISDAARNLITSLVFGLGEMARTEKSLSFSVAGVEAFARFLVRRMVNARTVMMHSAALARRQSQIRRVHQKLSQGPFELREIYRNLSLPAGECTECLQWMQKVGIVRQANGGKWDLIEDARLSFDDCITPLLEV